MNQHQHQQFDGSNKAENESALSVGLLLTALRRWWAITIPAGIVLAAIAGAAVYFTFVPKYRAAALVKIYERQPIGVYKVEIDNSSRFVDNQREMIRSKKILEVATFQSELSNVYELTRDQDAVQALRNQINVKRVGNSELMEISFESRSSEDARRVANAVADAYYEYQTDSQTELTKRVIGGLDIELKKRADAVEMFHTKVEQLSAKFYAGANSTQPGTTTPLNYLQTQIADADVERTLLEVDRKALESALAEFEISKFEIDRQIDADTEVRSLRDAINGHQAMIGDLKSNYKDLENNRKYQQTLQLLEKDEARLTQLETDLRPVYAKQLRESVENDLQVRIQRADEEIKRATLKFNTLNDRLHMEAAKGSTQGSGFAELERARSELGQAQLVHRSIDDRLTRLSTELDLAPSRVQIYDRAKPPKLPVESLPLKKMLAASTVAFCIPFGLVIGWELLQRRVADRGAVENKVAVIGEICQLPTTRAMRRAHNGGRSDGSLRLFEESVDQLRTQLLVDDAIAEARVIVICSATTREGKTSVASQLSTSIAKATTEPVLLIDGDMRAPDMHDIFQLDLEAGLVDVLEGETTLAEAVQKVPDSNLRVLTAGRLRCSPHSLLGSGALKHLLIEAREQYRYIVLDTPPVLAASESLLMAKHGDATLICAMRDVTKIQQMEMALKQLKGAGAHTVGAVLSGVPTRHYAYRYGAYGYNLAEVYDDTDETEDTHDA